MSDFYRQGPQWIAVAKKTGSLSDARFFPLQFGIAGSEDEMLSRIEATLVYDADFRNKFKGWNFGAMRADKVIRVDESGCVLIHRSEHQEVSARNEARRPTVVLGGAGW